MWKLRTRDQNVLKDEAEKNKADVNIVHPLYKR